MEERREIETTDLNLQKQVELVLEEANARRPDRVLRLVGSVIKPVRKPEVDVNVPNVQ